MLRLSRRDGTHGPDIDAPQHGLRDEVVRFVELVTPARFESGIGAHLTTLSVLDAVRAL